MTSLSNKNNLPDNFMLVRHGLSEANIFQKGQFPNGAKLEVVPEEFGTRHDSLMRLSQHGTEQAEAAGVWLKNWLEANSMANFERFYVSPHLRTKETAAHLGLGGEWRVDDRLRERDWGLLAPLSKEVQDTDHKAVMALKKQNEWYWQPPSGESLATGVRTRFTQLMDSLYRKPAAGSIIAVTHGELIRTAQFVLERMTPQQWLKMDSSGDYRIKNCMILHYTRVNPVTGEKSDRYTHRRAICPWNSDFSWNGEQWSEIEYKLYSDKELLNSLEKYPRLL